MGKKRITTYTFDASAKTIAFGAGLEIEGFLLITNVVDNIIIYNFADAALGGTYAVNTLTLTYNTVSMSDTDELLIMYDDGAETIAATQSGTWDEVGINDSGNSITVDGSVTANAGTNLNTSALALETGGNLAAIKTNTDDIETLLTTIEGNQLIDGHNVTVDNESIAVTGTFYQATQPVSGTVTANLSATDNAVLDDIASDSEAIKTSLATSGGLVVNLGANNDVTVTGSVTADLGANNDVTVTSGAITETNSGAIKTAVEKIDDAISGSEMQVDVLTMPTTTVQATNLDIRDLSQATDGVAIYGSDDGGTTKRLIKTDAGGAIQVDLEVTGVTVDSVTIDNEGGASAVNIQDGGNSITIDGSVTANAGTNLNTSALAVETGGNLASIKTNTDKIPSQGQALATASLPVVLPVAQITTLTPPAAITGFATSAKQDTIAGYVDGIEGLLTTIDADTSNLSVVGGGAEATALRVTIANNSTGVLSVDDNGGALTVDGTVTAELSATDNAVLDTIAAKDFATQTTLAAMNAKMVTGTDIGDVTINNGTGANAVNIQDGGNAITVDGTVAVTNAGITTIAGAVAGTEMQVDVLTMPTVTVTGALTDTQLRATAVPVSVATIPSHNVTNAGTFATQATLAAETTKVIGTVNVAASQSIGVTQATAGNLNMTEANSGSIKTAVEKIDDAISGSEMQVDVVAALPAGTNAIGKLAANSGVDIGDVDVTSLPGSGMSIFRSIDLDESEEDVKTSAGTLYGWYIQNKNAATLYLKFYNATAANTTVGTTTPILTIPVPTGAAANVEYTNGITFDTALCAAVTTGVADNDTGAPGANDFIANIFYK